MLARSTLTNSRTLGRVPKAKGLPWLYRLDPVLPIYSAELSWTEGISPILCLIDSVRRDKKGLELVGMDVRPLSLPGNLTQGRKKEGRSL